MSALPVEKYHLGPRIGRGSYSHVHISTSTPSNHVVALKKSRVSLRVHRTMLAHEARVLALLQGHAAVPKLVGYARAPHFEYLAMELLGPTLREKMEAGKALDVRTIARIGLQMLSALEHIAAKGIAHRDIKPANILLHPSDPARVQLIDFGIARLLHVPPSAPRAAPEDLHVVGTLDWCSVRAHAHLPLGPHDDLESLAYTLLFAHIGSLPWRIPFSRPYVYEPVRAAQRRVGEAKRGFSGSDLAGLPLAEIGRLLDCARAHDGLAPDYGALVCEWTTLAERLGADERAPLHWTPAPAPKLPPSLKTQERPEKILPQDEDRDSGDEGEADEEGYSNSYYAMDIDCWDDRQEERSASATVPGDEGAVLDASVARIVVVDEEAARADCCRPVPCGSSTQSSIIH